MICFHDWVVEHKNGETFRTCMKCGKVQKLIVIEKKIKKIEWVTII